DDVDLLPDQLGGDLAVTIVASFGPAILHRDRAIPHVAELAQALQQRGDQLAPASGCRAEDADGRQLARLLRVRLVERQDRRGCRPGDERHESAAFHSITSSASASSVGGMFKPAARAVLRLITRLNLLGAWIGSSVGLAPRRMRST